MTENAAIVRVYLPDTFISDARECDPDMQPLWQRIESMPRVRRGGGTGSWVDLTPSEVALIHKEAVYRAEYWLTDAYGVEDKSNTERAAGRAAQRVAEATRVIPPGGNS